MLLVFVFGAEVYGCKRLRACVTLFCFVSTVLNCYVVRTLAEPYFPKAYLNGGLYRPPLAVYRIGATPNVAYGLSGYDGSLGTWPKDSLS